MSDLKFGADKLKDKCYHNSLIIGKNPDDEYVLRYGMCKDGKKYLYDGQFFLPSDGENAEDVVKRCRDNNLLLNTKDLTSTYLPNIFGFPVRKLKFITGYGKTKLLTVLPIMAREMMLKEVIYSKKITFGKVLGLIEKYAIDHDSELGRYGVMEGDYTMFSARIVNNMKFAMFNNGINIQECSHFSVCKHSVANTQSTRFNDGLPLFKDLKKSNYLSTLYMIEAFTLFDSVNGNEPLISEDDRIRYETVIAQFYKDVLLMAQVLDIDLKSDHSDERGE